MKELRHLAELLRERNVVDMHISALIGRPATPGHIAEYIASHVFRLRLANSASQKGIDGHFTDGHLAGHSVNVKWSSKNDGMLDITTESAPDYYLVLTGPKVPPESSRGKSLPWVITFVYLFNHGCLSNDLHSRGVKLGTAASVRKELWADAEIFPSSNSNLMRLSEEERSLLSLFTGPS